MNRFYDFHSLIGSIKRVSFVIEAIKKKDLHVSTLQL